METDTIQPHKCNCDMINSMKKKYVKGYENLAKKSDQVREVIKGFLKEKADRLIPKMSRWYLDEQRRE